MKNVLLAALLIVALAGSPAAEEGGMPREYSLDELMALALKRAESIRISEEELYFAERQVDRARAVFFPRLSAVGEYREYAESETDSSASWGARLDQSFSLSGRELTAFKVAKLGVKKGRLDLHAVKEDYVFKVADACYDVLRAKKALEASTANLQRLRRHKEAARARVEVGEAARTALLRAEAELAAAVSGTVRAEGNLRLARALLASLVAIEEDYEIKDPEPGEPSFEGCVPGHPDVLDCLKKKAAAKRADLRSFALQKEMSVGQVKYAKGAYWPTASLEGVYLKNEVEPPSEFYAEETIYGGLTLSVPIFDWGLRKAELKQARARERQAGFVLGNARKSVYVQVQRAYLELMSQREMLVSSGRQLEFASENYNVVSSQFEVGLSSTLDVMDANTLLVDSERQATDAEIDYQLSVLRLKKETGMLLNHIMKNKDYETR